MRDLIERLEKAKGADRELDFAIASACGFDVRLEGSNRTDQSKIFNAYDCNNKRISSKFTSSIDAAVALVERALPGWTWTLDSASSTATLWKDDEASEATHQVPGATPAIALCIALLRAKEARAEE